MKEKEVERLINLKEYENELRKRDINIYVELMRQEEDL